MDNPPAKLSQDIIFDWSPELVATCTRQFIWRNSRRTQALFLLLLAIGIFFLVKGRMGGLVLIAVCAWFVFLLFRHYSKAVRLAKERSDRKVTVRVDPESIFLSTSQQESTIKLSDIKLAWNLPDALMLFPHTKSQYIALPVASLGEDLRQYIVTNIRKNGGKVT